MISHPVTLDYTLASGWLVPYVDALRAGRTLGRQCAVCKAVSFPPLRVCPCGATEGDWVVLPGPAHVAWRTFGVDGHFGLVRFEGATTHTTVKLVDFGPEDTVGHLLACPVGLPMLRLIPLPKEAADG